MSTGSAAIPLLKAAPEADQLSDRLSGGPWRGLEVCLAGRHVADHEALVRAVATTLDAVAAVEALVAAGRWGGIATLASSVATPLRRAAELVREAAGSSSPIETPGGELPPGENASYTAPDHRELDWSVRPLEEAIPAYVDWLRRHPAAQGRARA